jgi:hypothetical protein
MMNAIPARKMLTKKRRSVTSIPAARTAVVVLSIGSLSRSLFFSLTV